MLYVRESLTFHIYATMVQLIASIIRYEMPCPIDKHCA